MKPTHTAAIVLIASGVLLTVLQERPLSALTAAVGFGAALVLVLGAWFAGGRRTHTATDRDWLATKSFQLVLAGLVACGSMFIQSNAGIAALVGIVAALFAGFATSMGGATAQKEAD